MKEKLYRSHLKELISPVDQASFMDEEIVQTGIYEYGSNVVNGMSKDQKIKWRDHTTTSRIHVLEEFEPVGTQKLIAEDIIEELNKVPINIRK